MKYLILKEFKAQNLVFTTKEKDLREMSTNPDSVKAIGLMTIRLCFQNEQTKGMSKLKTKMLQEFDEWMVNQMRFTLYSKTGKFHYASKLIPDFDKLRLWDEQIAKKIIVLEKKTGYRPFFQINLKHNLCIDCGTSGGNSIFCPSCLSFSVWHHYNNISGSVLAIDEPNDDATKFELTN